MAQQGDGPDLDPDPVSMPRPGDRPEDATSSPGASPARPGRVRAEPGRGLIVVADAAGGEGPYLVTRAEALMVLVPCDARPRWISGAEMRRLEPRIYNPAVILARLRGKGLPGFGIESDAGRRMRLAIDEPGPPDRPVPTSQE